MATSWNEWVVYSPYTGPNEPWNFWGINYSNASGVTDPAQYVAVYGQTVNYNSTTTNAVQLWGATFECNDQSGAAGVPGGARIGVEVDLTANGPRNGAVRDGVSSCLMKGPGAAPVNAGSAFKANGPTLASGGGGWEAVLSAYGVYSAAFVDMRPAYLASGAHGIWFADGQDIALSTDGKATVRWDAANGKFKLSYGGLDVFSVDRSGNMRIRGALSQGVLP